MPTTSMKSGIGHNLLCPTMGYSVFKETILPTTHMKISSNRLLDHAIKGGAIRCDVQQIRSLNASAGTELSMETPEVGSTDQLKIVLKNSLQGLNRGVFGVPVAKRTEIEKLLMLLEEQNPVHNPTENLQMVEGRWKLLYSTITILGSKRTKLGLRDFIALGEFVQTINTKEGKAVNTIGFSVAGLGMLTGELTIEASFKIASPKRVDIQFERSAIAPETLLNLFRKNYDILLSIFNPQGWLEITYVDNITRIGRDDKGNVFLLERVAGEKISG